MAEWVIERLRPAHERAAFTCGAPSLEQFLHTLVTQYEKRRLGRTYVATEPGALRVAGYYTLAAGSFDVTSLPPAEAKKLPKHPVPTIHVGRLAVDLDFRGRRVGETLLFHALRMALEFSDKLGAFSVDVRAIDDAAKSFYERYGFVSLADQMNHLYLPMKSIAAMFAK